MNYKAVLQRFLHKTDRPKQHRHLQPPTDYSDKVCPFYAGSSLVWNVAQKIRPKPVLGYLPGWKFCVVLRVRDVAKINISV